MCKMDDINRENHSFLMPSIARNYGKAPKIKLSRDKFIKESKCALTYGALNACQTIMDSHQKDPYKNVDEMRGDLMLIIVGAHEIIKRELNLKIPSYGIDDIIARYEGANA